MPTEKQIAANRLNAQKSTGPKTDAGKLTTRLNSLKHGLAAQLTVLPFESQAEYDALENDLLEDIQPPTLAGVLLVKRFAQKQWLVQRLAKHPKPSPDPFEGLVLCTLGRTKQCGDMDLTSTVRSTEGRSECQHQISDGLTNTW